MTDSDPMLARLTAALADRYVIERELGAGGMATVYLAHDVRHDRKVAVKVLKPELAAMIGGERFLTEIKTTANLQHPHILPLFDSGSAESFLYYVMPYIEGESLRGRLNRERQLGVEESLRITRDVADALDYAHRQGVIHRDIKPENILLHDGRPVVADFGIALAISAAGGGRMTETGLSLGTPHYMSPEQATADRDLSPRSDVYSLACVLYEMLSGDPPHTGPSAQAILVRILTENPRSVSEARTAVPPHVAAVLAKALEKLPADRFDSAKAFAEALEDPTFSYTARTPGRGTAAITAPPARKTQSRTPLLAVGAVAVLALALVAWTMLRPEPPQPVVRLDLALGEITPNGVDDVVISPDGTTLAVAGTRSGEQAVWIRRIGEADFTKLAGTESARNPSFSPDSRWLVFRRQSDGALVKVSSVGGGTITLFSGGDPSPYWPHWGTEEWIVFISPSGLFRIPATGGTPELIPGGGGLWPFLLPDGSGILHSASNNVNFFDFATDSSKVLVPNARHPSYVATGHLLYVAEDGGLFAVPFDLGKHEVTGPPVRVLDRVAATGVRRGYSISRDGILVHHEGQSALGGLVGDRRFLIRDFDGGVDTVRLPPGGHFSPRFSPDGRMIAYGSTAATGGDDIIFTFDLVSGTNTQITFEGSSDDPIWSPDGTRLVFDASNVDGADGEDLYVKAADNSGPALQLLTRPGNQWPTGWLADGTILYSSGTAGNMDLFTVTSDSGGEPRVYLEAPWREANLTVSPDGTLGAFEADEAGRRDIWLRTFPVAEGKWRVTTGGVGVAPRWSPDGQYVYFTRAGAPEDSLFRVRVDRTAQGGVVVRGEELVLTHDISGIGNWDLHPDGRRALITVAGNSGPTPTGEGGTDRYLVVLNWFSEMLSRIGREGGGQ